MSAIRADAKEYLQLELECKRLRANLKKLNDQKNKCAKRILEYLEQTKQEGFVYDNHTIVKKDIMRSKNNTRKLKLEKGKALLSQYGIDNADRVMKELMEQMKGDMEPDYRIQVKNSN